MKLFVTILTLILSPFLLVAKPSAKSVAEEAPPAGITVNEIKYEWQLTQDRAKFTMTVDLDATGSGPAFLPLLEGEVAVLTAKLPGNITLSRETGRESTGLSPASAKIRTDNRRFDQ